jgi:hypothetical protein
VTHSVGHIDSAKFSVPQSRSNADEQFDEQELTQQYLALLPSGHSNTDAGHNPYNNGPGNTQWDDQGVSDYLAFDTANHGFEQIGAQHGLQGGSLSPSQLQDQFETYYGSERDYGDELRFLEEDVPNYGDNKTAAQVAMLSRLRQDVAANHELLEAGMSPEELSRYNANITKLALTDPGDGSHGELIKKYIESTVRTYIHDDTQRSAILERLDRLSGDQVNDIYDVNLHLYNHKAIRPEPSESGIYYFFDTHAFAVNYAPEDGSEAGTLAFYNSTGGYSALEKTDALGISTDQANRTPYLDRLALGIDLYALSDEAYRKARG